jgi:hypothetical protein
MAAVSMAVQRGEIEQLEDQLKTVEWQASIAEAEAAAMKQQKACSSEEFKIIKKQLALLTSPRSAAPGAQGNLQ